ncbi:DUF2271 domain-containing protein [Pusillimonas sp. DMV24BSW_D]|nr:DUF2271 domain-containing protein [Pusillimonas sp. DMV24BSW_D]QIM47971.1 DUF2271 domain-containing protein [Pusillimonas sp. DMV24BSW_D]
MKRHLNTVTLLALASAFPAGTALAGELSLDLTLPRIDTAEYHRPYVAVWLESDDRKVVRDLALWYDTQMADDEGRTWLKDLRQWWRLSGRYQDTPADGVSSATRPVGKHNITIAADAPALQNLPAGHYEVVVEAAREKGGRELIRLPLPWPLEKAVAEQQNGKHELGEISLKASP